jgi:hypothetical protein
MTFIYYVDSEKFTTDDYGTIPWDDISSPDENTPGFECTIKNIKEYCSKNQCYHRLTGPALIENVILEMFFINNVVYENVKDWISNHPNPDLYFHNIDVFTETDKVLWYLQN